MFHVYLRPVTLGTYRINIGPNVIEPPRLFIMLKNHLLLNSPLLNYLSEMFRFPF